MNLEKKYKTMFGENSNGWGSEQSQRQRFEIIKDIGMKAFNTILDVGCGTGDFTKFFYESKFYKHNYVGIDLRSDIIERAKRSRPEFNFLNKSISGISGSFDYVIGSGIFCFQETRWKHKTYTVLNEMFQRANIAVVVNFLKVHAKLTPLKGIHYAIPEEIVRITEFITKRYIIRTDYRDNDMTVYLYK